MPVWNVVLEKQAMRMLTVFGIHLIISSLGQRRNFADFGKMVTISQDILAPPAGRQRSFSNADSSVVVVVGGVNFSLKMLISLKHPDNLYCIVKNINLIKSS